MKCTSTIAILMATYNGAAYLSQQLDSLLGQTFADWHLYIHDDGSTDETNDILARYADVYPQQITVFDYPSQGGACRNFLSLLERVEAPYYMFCDQDDVWLSGKIEKTFHRMQEEEGRHGKSPVIVHSDLCLVDARLNRLSPSFIRDQQIKIDKIKTFDDYASTNTVTGCAMMLNQEARQIMKRPYDKALMHDAWICLSVAANDGIVAFIDEPLVLYRQHGDNTLGARDMSKFTWLSKLRNLRRMMRDTIAHYHEMNAVRPISPLSFVKSKIRYKKG